MKQKHTKYTQINTNKSTHSEMSPVWQNPIQRTVRTAHLSASVHNTTQNSSDNLPSCLQTNIIAEMSIGGEGAHLVKTISTITYISASTTR